MQRKLAFDDVIERDPDVIDAVAGNDVVMVRLANGSYYAVSDVSRLIWDRLKTPAAIEDIVTSLAEQYDVDLGVCRRETMTFLERMLDESLIRVSG